MLDSLNAEVHSLVGGKHTCAANSHSLARWLVPEQAGDKHVPKTRTGSRNHMFWICSGSGFWNRLSRIRIWLKPEPEPEIAYWFQMFAFGFQCF